MELFPLSLFAKKKRKKRVMLLLSLGLHSGDEDDAISLHPPLLFTDFRGKGGTVFKVEIGCCLREDSTLQNAACTKKIGLSHIWMNLQRMQSLAFPQTDFCFYRMFHLAALVPAARISRPWGKAVGQKITGLPMGNDTSRWPAIHFSLFKHLSSSDVQWQHSLHAVL